MRLDESPTNPRRIPDESPTKLDEARRIPDESPTKLDEARRIPDVSPTKLDEPQRSWTKLDEAR
jgi:hypothetical protein